MKKKFNSIKIKIDENEIKELRYKRGKADAEAGFPPSHSSQEYMDGYNDWRQVGDPCSWSNGKLFYYQ